MKGNQKVKSIKDNNTNLFEDKKFCRRCSTPYDSLEEAKSACENEKNCAAVYDLFCDGKGYFCTCNVFSVFEQTHRNGMDCIYHKPSDP